jgi:hypothetical protein
MANINWNRHSYKTQMDRDYYRDPKKGFDSAWHNQNRKNKAKKENDKLLQARAKIQALRKNKTQG